MRGGAGDHLVDGVAILVALRDVEKAELIRPRRVVDPRLLDRVAGVHEIDEADTLDDASGMDVQAGDDADLQHATPLSCPRRRASMPATRAIFAGRGGFPLSRE